MLQIFRYSVGRKFLMALTGIFLCIFLVVHLSGNLLLFKGDNGKAFNEYSEFMSTNLFIRINEIILLLGFLFHIADAIILTIQNKRARPVNYAVNAASENSSLFSRTMSITGSIIFIFLVIHLNTFFVEHRILGSSVSMYESVIKAFSNLYYSGFYIVAMILMGFHLNHGFKSMFQSLGLNHTRYNGMISKSGLLFSIIIPVGFMTMPIYFYITSNNLFVAAN